MATFIASNKIPTLDEMLSAPLLCSALHKNPIRIH
jgi:hypothetical protein